MTELKAPIVVVNFKTYREVEGVRAIEVAKVCEDVAEQTGTTIIVCPPTLELARVAQAIRIPVFCQHTDAKSAGREHWLDNPIGCETDRGKWHVVKPLRAPAHAI